MLQNKEGLWKSSDLWIFSSNESLIFIGNINKTMVWGISNDSKVILEILKKDVLGQSWKKGEPDAEGWFTLENYKVSKFVTAASSTSLELKGNIALRWIPPTC